jgi:hypothetical protein
MYLISLIDPTKFLEATALVVAGTLGVIWGVVKFWQGKKKDDNFIEVHTEIHELLTELRVKNAAMRASIIQFHNGEYTMDGISMRKFSVTHESTHKGYTSQVMKLKGTLCSMYIPLLTKIVDNKSTIHHTNMLPHSYVKGFFEDENVSQYACLPLKNKGANVGFILIQWHRDFEIPSEAHEEAMNNFETIRDSIEMQLSQQKN